MSGREGKGAAVLKHGGRGTCEEWNREPSQGGDAELSCGSVWGVHNNRGSLRKATGSFSTQKSQYLRNLAIYSSGFICLHGLNGVPLCHVPQFSFCNTVRIFFLRPPLSCGEDADADGL